MMATAFYAAITVGCMRITGILEFMIWARLESITIQLYMYKVFDSLLASLIGALLILRFSKRSLMVLSSAMMTIFMTALAVTIYFKDYVSDTDKVF